MAEHGPIDFYPLPEGSSSGSTVAPPEQRRYRRELIEWTRSDLHERAVGRYESVLMRSPLGWAVEIGDMQDGRCWAAVYKPDGSRLAITTDATIPWLDATLP